METPSEHYIWNGQLWSNIDTIDLWSERERETLRERERERDAERERERDGSQVKRQTVHTSDLGSFNKAGLFRLRWETERGPGGPQGSVGQKK